MHAMPRQNLLDAINKCDNFPYPPYNLSSSDPLQTTLLLKLNDIVIGRILPSVLPALIAYNKSQTPAPFEISKHYVEFSSHLKTVEDRTATIKDMIDLWRANKTFTCLAGWRDELYPVYLTPKSLAFVMERSATPLLGVPTFGVHLNAYAIDPETGKIKMWIARRSKTKQTWPGMLDNCVAGGITYGQSAYETILKECAEEASIPKEIASQVRSVGVITYFMFTDNGLQPEIQYCFDVELPKDVQPKPEDGEAECFYLWDIDEVKRNIEDIEFKPNCALVVIDFMIRHSLITAENEPAYLEIVKRMHRQLEFPLPNEKI